MLDEEGAPANSVGGGGIAGVGVGPQGEPGVSPRVQKKRYGRLKSQPNPVMMDILRRKSPNMMAEDTFAGSVVFEVSGSTFHNARMEKRKGKHWKTYLDECDELAEIREYAAKYPRRPIILRNRTTSEMVYVRYGKKM